MTISSQLEITYFLDLEKFMFVIGFKEVSQFPFQATKFQKVIAALVEFGERITPFSLQCFDNVHWVKLDFI